MRTKVAKEAFQVTELQRNYRVVLSEARESGALIRDKDGLMLIIQPAGDVQRTQYLNELMADVLRMTRVLHSPQSERSAFQDGGVSVFCNSRYNSTEYMFIRVNVGSARNCPTSPAEWNVEPLVSSFRSRSTTSRSPCLARW